MQAEFYKFSKRKNSTAVPVGSGLEVELTLKNGASILQPTFFLSTNVSGYNYCNFNGRYYWINDITSVRNGLWEVQCRVDVLASWKSEILETSAFVSYSSNDNNQMVKDNRNVLSTSVKRSESFVNFDMFNSSGSYILATLSGPASEAINNSFSVLYGLDAGSLGALAQEFNSPDALTAIKQYFDNPTETIVFCRWLPRNLIGGPTRIVPVKFGDYQSNVTGTLIEDNFSSEIKDIAIPWQSNDFRNYEPYSTAILYLPGVGNVSINLQSLAGLNTLSIKCVMDYVTNGIHYQITDGTGANIIATYSGSVGVDIPISAIQSGNVGGIIAGLGTVAGGVGAVISGGISAGAVGAIGGGLTALGASSISQNVRSSGAFAGGYNVKAGGTTVHLEITRNLSVQEPSEYVDFMGNPCMKYRKISGLSGYCQTENFQVSGEMLDSEKTEINNMLNGGVYIE
jgi:hypothetical protein